MVKVAAPVSRLFKNSTYAKEIIRHSDCLECRDETINFSGPKQELFHCNLQPIHNFTEEEFAFLKEINKTKPELKLATFHCASSCDRPYLRNGMFLFGGRKYSRSQMQENAKRNFLRIKEIFGDGIKMGIENNNYFPTEAYRYVTEPEFISDIIYDNNIEFLFDIAHAKITSYNKNISYEKYKIKLPLDRIIQLHVSHYGINKNNLAYDAHNCPDEDLFEEVRKMVNDFNIKYLTVEYYKDVENLVNTMKILKELKDELY